MCMTDEQALIRAKSLWGQRAVVQTMRINIGAEQRKIARIRAEYLKCHLDVAKNGEREKLMKQIRELEAVTQKFWCVVGRESNNPFGDASVVAYGRGDTWEEAFVDAAKPENGERKHMHKWTVQES